MEYHDNKDEFEDILRLSKGARLGGRTLHNRFLPFPNPTNMLTYSMSFLVDI